jgi:predicted  nucleic acid-binding Zn-ribbon protein
VATFDDHANLAITTVAVAPIPAASGTSLEVVTGVTWPTVPFNVTIWPAATTPNQSNAEIVRVTNIVVGATDTLTITRAQEGTSARTILATDNLANTATDKVFTDIEEAIASVVDVISNLISAGGGGVSVISAELASVDARVTSVNNDVSVLSQAVSVISQQVSVLSQAHSVLSNRVSALSSQVSTVSELATAADLHASTASAAATSVDARLNTLSGLHHTLSDKVVSISAQLVSLEVHASAASAAATSVDSRVTSVNTFICTQVSAHTALSGAGSVKGLQSALNAIQAQTSLLDVKISNIISAGGGGTSVTSAEHASVDAKVSVLYAIGQLLSLQNVDASAVSAGCPIYAFTSANTFKKANASAIGTELVLGLVFDGSIGVSAVGRVQTGGRMSLTSAQWFDVTGVSGLTPGDVYYLGTSAGTLTTAAPSGSAVVHVVGQALSPNEMQLMLTPWDDATSTLSALSAADTSIDARVTSVNTALSALVALSVGGVSTFGLQSIINALSNRISAGGGSGSVTSAEHASVDARVTSVAALLSNAISAGSATASAICALLSGISSRSALSAGVSTHGLQSVIDALSNRISLNAKAISDIISAGGGGTSVTSAELVSLLSTVSTNASVNNQSIVNMLSALTVRTSTGGATSVKGIQSALDALSNQVSDTVTSLRQTSADLDAKVSTLSDQVVSISAQLVSIDLRITSINVVFASISVLSVGGTSVKGGMQSLFNALSNRISAASGTGGAGSVTSDEASAISHNASVNNQSIITFLSGLSITNATGASVRGLQSIFTAISDRISGARSLAFVVSDAVTSVNNRVNSVNTFICTQVSAHTALSGSGSVKGLQSALNAIQQQTSLLDVKISNIISAGGGGVSVTSNDLSILLAAQSAQAASALSNAISAGSATASNLLSNINVVSAKLASVAGQLVVLANDTNVSAGALTTIAGLSATLSASGIYEMRAMVAYTTSAGQVLGFGLNFGGMTHAAGHIHHTNIGQGSNQSTVSTIDAAFDENGSGSIVMSIYASVAGGTGTKHVAYEGMFVVSTSAPDPIHLLAKASSGTGQIVCKKGSFLRLYKLG